MAGRWGLVNDRRRAYVRVMGLTWTESSDGDYWTAWAPIAWNGSDLEVGYIHRLATGWRARYWGRDQSARFGPQLGADRLAVGGLWPDAETAKAAVEERHAGPSACEGRATD